LAATVDGDTVIVDVAASAAAAVIISDAVSDVRFDADAVSVLAPASSMLRPGKLATPPAAVTVVVPTRDPVPDVIATSTLDADAAPEFTVFPN